jgi:hypothetical protein
MTSDDRKGQTRMSSIPIPRLLKPAEAADLLNVSQRTLERLSAKGAISRPVRVGSLPRYEQGALLKSIGLEPSTPENVPVNSGSAAP